jgi:hypothetical protein
VTREPRRSLVGFVVAAAMIIAVLLAARRHRPDDAPFVPRDDVEVLERIAGGQGADPAADALRALEAELARAPTDLHLAARVARAHIEAARSSGDARRLSYAEAALTPFWKTEPVPTSALLLRATIRQSRHEFAAALGDLDVVIGREKNAQALLTRASVLLVLGRWDEARASCARLVGVATPLVEAACLAQVEGVVGDAGARARLLVLAAAPGTSAADRAWASSIAGEAAWYAGDTAGAEKTLRAALDADPGDAYTRALLCDLLLDAGRDAEVLTLVRADEPNEVLLLRRAIAAGRTQAADAGALAERLKAREVDLRARGDHSHLREEARRLLTLEHDPVGALAAAQANFEQQKEPWDARVLLEAAVATRSEEGKTAARPALEWLARSKCAWPPLEQAGTALGATP